MATRILSLAIHSALILLVSAKVLCAQEPDILCYEDQDYQPYLVDTSDEPRKPNPGVLVELSQLAFKKVGLDIRFVRRPWKRCMRLVQEGQAVGMFGVIYLQEREKVGMYPMKNDKPDDERRLLSVDYPIFTQTKTKPFWDGKSFQSKHSLKIGTPLGYATVKSLENDHHIKPNTTYLPEEGLRLVADYKMDGYIVEKYVGLSLLKKLHLEDKLVPQMPPFQHQDLYLLLSHQFYKRSPQIAEKLWSVIGQLRQSHLPGIMAKYMKLAK